MISPSPFEACSYTMDTVTLGEIYKLAKDTVDNIGIHAMELYIPRLFVNQAELGKLPSAVPIV